MCILIAAVVCDLSTYKIPNQLMLAGGLLGMGLQFYRNSLQGLAAWLCGTVGIMVIFYILFYLSMIGAGDIKLFGIMGGFLGIKDALILVAVTFLIAAFIAIILFIKRRNIQDRLKYFIHYIQKISVYGNFQYMDFENKDRQACMHMTLPLLLAFICMNIIEYSGWRFGLF